VLNSFQIANYFIKSSQDKGGDISPMKLLKLCYIAHGWYMAFYNEDLIDETIYAWKYGPVIESIYHQFKPYGNGQINRLYSNPFSNGKYPLPNDKAVEDFLDLIWDSYGKYTGVELSSMTHQQGTPWDIVWNKNRGCDLQHAIIPNELIKEHYQQLLIMKASVTIKKKNTVKKKKG